MTARIFQLARSAGGVPKLGMHEALVGELGIDGDKQKHIKFHGGPKRALCLYSLELIQKLQGEGHPIYPGSTGENVTISGLDWSALAEGTQLALGDQVIAQLTWTTDPCKQIAGSFVGRDFRRLFAAGEMRWYASIVQIGVVRVGMPVRVL